MLHPTKTSLGMCGYLSLRSASGSCVNWLANDLKQNIVLAINSISMLVKVKFEKHTQLKVFLVQIDESTSN